MSTREEKIWTVANNSNYYQDVEVGLSFEDKLFINRLRKEGPVTNDPWKRIQLAALQLSILNLPGYLGFSPGDEPRRLDLKPATDPQHPQVNPPKPEPEPETSNREWLLSVADRLEQLAGELREGAETVR